MTKRNAPTHDYRVTHHPTDLSYWTTDAEIALEKLDDLPGAVVTRFPLVQVQGTHPYMIADATRPEVLTRAALVALLGLAVPVAR